VKNKIIIWLIINSLLIQLTGCYTFNEIEKTDSRAFADSLIENCDIKIQLVSGEEIFSEANFHSTYADTADNFVGTGRKYSPDDMEGKFFTGQIFKSEIDSSKIGNNFIHIWLKDKHEIVFEQKNYREYTLDDDTGIWLTNNGNPEKISDNDIQSLKIGEVNPALTTLYVVGIVALVTVTFGIIWAASEFQGFSQ